MTLFLRALRSYSNIAGNIRLDFLERVIMRPHCSLTAAAIGAIAMTCSTLCAADTKAADEAAIRKQIEAADNRKPGTAHPDQVFWSGAYKRPAIRPEKPEPRTGGKNNLENRVAESHKSRTEPVRIVISESGDLAYEYSKVTLEFDLKSGEHTVLHSGLLRVWQKRDGQWKSAAHFSFPYDQS